MTTWIGQPASMRPTPCVSAAPVTHEDRTIFGGGAGTLSPRRVLHVATRGAARTWQPRYDVSDTHEMASVVQLAHAQRALGQGWRVIPCEAVDTNCLTEQATESLIGWYAEESTNLHPITQRGFDIEYVTRRVPVPGGMVSVLEDGVVLQQGVVLGPGGDYYEVVDEIEHLVWPSLGWRHSTRVTTPHVPMLDRTPWTVYVGAFHTGQATVRLDGYNAAGTFLWSQTMSTLDHGAELRRTQGVVEVTPSNTATVRLSVIPTTGTITSCWPSIQFGKRPHLYVPGRGCDEAWLTVADHDPYMTTPDQHLTSWGYTITETGV